MAESHVADRSGRVHQYAKCFKLCEARRSTVKLRPALILWGICPPAPSILSFAWKFCAFIAVQLAIHCEKKGNLEPFLVQFAFSTKKK